jgi:hypothetical protein
VTSCNVSINALVQLVAIGGNGDYNKNNTQTVGNRSNTVVPIQE